MGTDPSVAPGIRSGDLLPGGPESRYPGTMASRAKMIVGALASVGITFGAYCSPLIVGAILAIFSNHQAEAEPEPGADVVEYMASMSLTPFPDPTLRALEVTEELLAPPKRENDPVAPKLETKAKTAPVEPVRGVQGTPVAAGAGAPSAESGSNEVSGGKVRGPTQDGEGSVAQECLPPNPEIHQVTSVRWRVAESLVSYYVNHLRAAEKLADTRWVEGKQGSVFGFRVLRVRCGNDLYQMGFRGGDTVLAVNGEPITSTSQAISAYMKVRNDKKIKVKLRRRGKEMEYEYILY